MGRWSERLPDLLVVTALGVTFIPFVSSHAVPTDPIASNPIQILLAVMIVMYCVMGELVRVIGAAKMQAMFFGSLPAKPV